MKLLIPYGSRSDAGLVEPLFDRMKAWRLEVYPGSFEKSYHKVDLFLKYTPIDLVLIVGDRIEMVGCAAAAFHNNIPIAHLYAGVKNTPPNTLDDINRHVITLWSEYQFVDSKEAKKNVIRLCKTVGKIPHVYTVGITHLDDISINESLVPEKEFNLILYNPPTRGRERLNIFVGPNEDIQWYKSLPRDQFLGLLKNTKCFISNSSTIVYEAPYFLDEGSLLHIGNRNRKRTKPLVAPGGADKIKEVISEIENIRNTHPRTVEFAEDTK